MAGQRQPTDLVVMKGKKHLTKAEIEATKKRGGGRPKRQSQASGIFDTGTKEEIPEDCQKNCLQSNSLRMWIVMHWRDY